MNQIDVASTCYRIEVTKATLTRSPGGSASLVEAAGNKMAFLGDSELRQRLIPENEPEYDSSLPYGGKVYLARKKKADPMYIRVAEVR